MSAPEIAVAYVSVVPSMRGFGQRLTRGVVGPATNAGNQAGQALSRGMQSATQSIQTAGTALTAGITAPVAALGTQVLRTSGNFEAGMNRVRAVSGATGSAFAGLESLARELGSTTQYSATEAADAMGYLAMAGFDAEEIMSSLPGVLNLAAAGAIDLATAADIASNILSGYGIEVEELGRVNDVLAKTFTSANVDMRMLGETFKYVGPVASDAGIEFEELSAAVGLLGNAGIQGSEAGTALRGAIGRLLLPTNEVQETLDRLGVSVLDSSGELRALHDIMGQLEGAGASTADMLTIFGLEAGPAMQALVSQGSDSLRELTQDLRDAGGTADEIADIQMEGLNGALTQLRSAWEGLLLAIGDSGLLDWATRLTESLGRLVGRLSETDSAFFRIGSVVAIAAAALGPVLAAVGFGITGVGAALAFLLSPVGAVIAAAGALAVAFAGLYAGSESFRETVHRIGGAIMDGAVAAFAALRDIVEDEVVPVLMSLGQGFRDFVEPIARGIIDMISGVLVPALLQIGQGVMAALIPTLRAVGDFISNRVAPALGTLGSRVGDLLQAVRPVAGVLVTFVGALYQVGGAIIGTVAPWLIRLAGPIFSALVSALSGAISAVTGFFNLLSWTGSTAVSVGSAIWDGLVTAFNAVSGALATVGQWFVTMWGTAQPILNTMFTVAKAVFTGIVVVSIGPLVAALTGLGALFLWLWDAAVRPSLQWIGDRAKWLWTSAILPAWRGIQTATRALADVLRWLARTIVRPTFDAISSAADTLWRRGIQPAWRGIRSATEAMADTFRWLRDRVVRPVFNTIRDIISGVWENGIRPAFNKIKDGVDSVAKAFRSAKNFIETQWNRLKNITKGPVNFVINTVYNRGIVKLWNKIADVIGGSKLQTATPLATGGILPGYTPGRDIHLAALSGGEAVMRPEWTRAVGPGFVNHMNAVARHGGVGAVRKAMSAGVPGYAFGGIIGNVRDALSGALDWAKETGTQWLGRGLNALIDNTLGRMPFADTGWGELVTRIPKHAVEELLNLSREKESEAGQWARPVDAPISTPYGARGSMWSSGYHTGSDFAAPTGTPIRAPAPGTVTSVASGGPYGIHIRTAHPGGLTALFAHLSSTAVRAGDSFANRGLLGRVGSTGNSSGPHLHLEAFRGGARIDPATLFDSGGWLRPGLQAVRNDTGRPEPVLTRQQWRDVSSLASRGADSGIRPGDRIVLSVDGRTEFGAYVDRRADARAESTISRTLISPARRGRHG